MIGKPFTAKRRKLKPLPKASIDELVRELKQSRYPIDTTYARETKASIRDRLAIARRLERAQVVKMRAVLKIGGKLTEGEFVYLGIVRHNIQSDLRFLGQGPVKKWDSVYPSNEATET